MKQIFALIAIAAFQSACSVASDKSGLEAVGKTNVYGVTFTDYQPAKASVKIVMTLGTKVVSTSVCSYNVVGAPSVGGPVVGTIKCDDRQNGLLADFSLLPKVNPTDTQLWAGRAYINRNQNGGEYGCFSDPASKNFLDCYYKAPAEPPHAGGVSN